MLQIVFTITNNGNYYAAEVAQLYITYPPSAGEPPKVRNKHKKEPREGEKIIRVQVLRGFNKLYMAPGESQDTFFFLDYSSITIYDIPFFFPPLLPFSSISVDITNHIYVPVKGAFTVLIGSSSRYIRLNTTFTY